MLISLAEYARQHGRDPATARQRALRGAFKTVQKIGRDWLIDSDEPWEDARIHSGAYVGARAKKQEKSVEKSSVSLDNTTLK